MEDLKINSTPKTPEIDFNLATGVFYISGVSVPENSLEFYIEINKWLKEYSKNPCDTTKLIFRLSYLNTSSLQSIYDMLMILDAIHNKSSEVNIEWHHLEEDIDMKEMGEDFKEALNVEFKLFEVESV